MTTPAPLDLHDEVDSDCADIDPLTDADRITCPDAAKLANGSTKTIFRAVKAKKIRGIPADGRTYVSVTDMIKTGMLSAERVSEAGNPRDTVELIRLRETSTGLREQLATATATVTSREAEIERALAQLREKDNQITRLLKIVEHQAARGGQR